MAKLQAILPKVAASDVPVLIHGETGTGKEVLARQLHALSPRANKPFVKLNCAAVPPELAESELFGHERGAFTGAIQRKPGIFEMADGGTVMLDEIGDMEFRLQAKLLQVLQDQEFRRVGGTETVRINVRVIAATHRDLRQAGENHTFRQDLYFRLNGFSLTMPALRERRHDIFPLAEFLYRRHHGRHSSMPASEGLKEALLRHDWPGNVRELEMVVRKLGVLGDPDYVAAELNAFCGPSDYDDGLVDCAAPQKSSPLEHASRTKDESEARAIRSALESTRWNRKQAAAVLQLDYKALLYKMKKLAIE
jgi:two-component system response regulator AtoC